MYQRYSFDIIVCCCRAINIVNDISHIHTVVHTVEVTGSNPVPPTNDIERL
jgi:hypothetical protein